MKFEVKSPLIDFHLSHGFLSMASLIAFIIKENDFILMFISKAQCLPWQNEENINHSDKATMR